MMKKTYYDGELAMTDEILRYFELTPNEIKYYETYGYLMLPGLISRETATVLSENVFEIMEGLGTPREDLRTARSSKDKLRQTKQYLADTPLANLINSKGLNAIASQLMSGSATLYLPFTAVKNGGGGGKFHFHQDNQYTRFDGPGINIWFALVEMTPENGCLQLAPSTHLDGTLDSIESEDKDGHRTVAVEPESFLPLRMMPGDAVAFTRLTLHGSGSNNTDEPRLGYAVQYHRDDVSATRNGELLGLLKDNPVYDIQPVTSFSVEND